MNRRYGSRPQGRRGQGRRNTVPADTTLPDGLVMHFDASDGLTTVGTDVTGWTDLAGSNDLNVIGDAPQLVAAGVGGNDYVAFDGVDDSCSRATFTGLPTGNTARTLATVIRYHGGGVGGVAYGDFANRQAYGCCVSGGGNFLLQVWGPDDFSSLVNADNIWAIHMCTWDGSVNNQQVNRTGVPGFFDGDDTPSAAMATDAAGAIEIGREIDGTPFVQIDVAEVMLWGSALNQAKRNQVRNYVAARYGIL